MRPFNRHKARRCTAEAGSETSPNKTNVGGVREVDQMSEWIPGSAKISWFTEGQAQHSPESEMTRNNLDPRWHLVGFQQP